jgi:hypothetical protein
MDTPYTEEQKRQFQEEFRGRRSRQWIVSLPIVAMLFATAVLRDREADTVAGFSSAAVGGTLIVLVLGVLVFSLWNWRCPACSGYLGKAMSPRFCAKCGVQLGS